MPCRILLERLLFFALARFTVGAFFRILRVCRVTVRLLLFLFKKDLVCKAQLHRLLRIHPGLIAHEVGDAGVAESALCSIGIDDAFLDLGQHLDGLFHVLGIAHRNRAGVMDHQHGNGTHLDSVTGHCHNRCGRCRNRIDLDRDTALVVLQHGINLGSGEHIAARRVDPDGQIPLAGFQLIPEHLRRDLIAPERFLVDGAFQPEDSGVVTVFDPVPEFLHRFLLPFFRGLLSLSRLSLSGSSSGSCSSDCVCLG